MRVLQVITDTDRRGAQVFACDLAQALGERRHDVHTVALAPGANIAGLDVPALGKTPLGRDTLRALRTAGDRVDVICAHGSSTLPACSLAGVGRSTPFVYRQISDSLFWASTWPRRLRVRFGLARARRIVALSRGSAGVLRDRFGVPAAKIDVIPNGVPRGGHRPAKPEARRAARRALGLPSEGAVVAVISALVPEKGVDLAIDAMAQDAVAQLVIAGDGPAASELRSKAETVAPGRVTFTGSVADPGSVYDAADVVLLPSRGGDSMPAALIEAGMRGLPVIATDVGAIGEVVVDGETGIVLREARPEPISASLRMLLTDPVRLRAMGRKAEQRCVERYEIGVVADLWAATLERAARKG